jgi:hypothetical protein
MLLEIYYVGYSSESGLMRLITFLPISTFLAVCGHYSQIHTRQFPTLDVSM